MEITVTPNANDIKLSVGLYDEAFKDGMNFSQFLEKINPSESDDGLDAFERQLKRYGIRTKHDPKRGLFASTGEYFFNSNQPESRILFPEYISRVARMAIMNQEDNVNELVASFENITGNGTYRSIYIDDTQAQRTKSRVGERGEFPRTKVSWSEKATTLKKYGVAIEMTYEFVRRASLPVIETLIGRIMIQNRLDEVDMALTVITSGDGNAKEGGAAGNTDLSDLGVSNPTSTSSLTYESWLRWLMAFFPGRCSTIVLNTTDYAKYMNMARPNPDPIWIYSLLDKSIIGGQPSVVNPRVADRIRVVVHDSVSDNVIVGLDRPYGIIGYRESNTDLTETNKIINGQWDEIVVSNTVGFAKLFESACKTLTTNA
jgi:hypothetical protein